MMSRAQVKHIRALHARKGREEHREFLAEGSKLVLEVLSSTLEIRMVCGLEAWIQEQAPSLRAKGISAQPVTEEEMNSITALSSPSPALAVVSIPEQALDTPLLPDTLTLALDNIQDPGNLGTIIRIADWFGIPQVVCSTSTVELYNPKVIQSTMGSFLRVTVVYRDLEEFLPTAKVPVFGTFLDGDSLYGSSLPGAGIILVGSEARGISPGLEKFITRKLTIPSFALSGSATAHAESLNAAIATAVVCAEFRRQNHG